MYTVQIAGKGCVHTHIRASLCLPRCTHVCIIKQIQVHVSVGVPRFSFNLFQLIFSRPAMPKAELSIYKHTHTCIYYIHTYTCICICMGACLYMRIVCIWLSVCVCVHIYVCVYTDIHTEECVHEEERQCFVVDGMPGFRSFLSSV